jgi:hypothetical protein
MNFQPDRGSIRSVEHYQQAKMLDHSSWQKGAPVLPRHITPSDVDMYFDNNGKIIFCELSTNFPSWESLGKGQRLGYENMIRGTVHCAVVCFHNIVPSDDRLINSRTDICGFQPMICDGTDFICGDNYSGNELWQQFIFKWFEDPTILRRKLIGFSVGLVKPSIVAVEAA